MDPTTRQIQAIDIGYLNLPGAANVFLVDGPKGFTLVESGTATTWHGLVGQLEACGVHPTQILDLLLTHIHLDHAGAAGHFAAGGSRIWAHPFGAPHLVDPTRLLSSSRRVHAELHERFYGDIWPSPPSQVFAVSDGLVVNASGFEYRAIDTPGHARHHLAWSLDLFDQRHLFVGDALGIAVPESEFISIPTPPPELDMVAWMRSLQALRAAEPTHLWLTHGGLQSCDFTGASRFIDRVQARLEEECALLQQLSRAALSCGARDSVEFQHGLRGATDEYTCWLQSKASAAGVTALRQEQFLGAAFIGMNLQGALRHESTRA